jgi:hypothetical protein
LEMKEQAVIAGLTRNPVTAPAWMPDRACPGPRSGVRHDKAFS